MGVGPGRYCPIWPRGSARSGWRKPTMGSLPAYPGSAHHELDWLDQARVRDGSCRTGGGSTMIGPSSTTVTGSTSAMASGRTRTWRPLPADTRRDLMDKYTAVLAETADAVRLNEARDVQRGTGMAITDAAHSGNGRRAIRIIAIRICTSTRPSSREAHWSGQQPAGGQHCPFPSQVRHVPSI